MYGVPVEAVPVHDPQGSSGGKFEGYTLTKDSSGAFDFMSAGGSAADDTIDRSGSLFSQLVTSLIRSTLST